MSVDRNKDFFIFYVWLCIHWDAVDQTLQIMKSCAIFSGRTPKHRCGSIAKRALYCLPDGMEAHRSNQG